MGDLARVTLYKGRLRTTPRERRRTSVPRSNKEQLPGGTSDASRSTAPVSGAHCTPAPPDSPARRTWRLRGPKSRPRYPASEQPKPASVRVHPTPEALFFPRSAFGPPFGLYPAGRNQLGSWGRTGMLSATSPRFMLFLSRILKTIILVDRPLSSVNHILLQKNSNLSTA